MVFYLFVLSLAIYFVLVDFLTMPNLSYKIQEDELRTLAKDSQIQETDIRVRTSFHLSSPFGPD